MSFRVHILLRYRISTVRAHQIGNMPVSPMTSTTRKPRKRTSLRKGAVCLICRHEHRVLIEQTRIAGASLDNIARKFGVSRDAVWRHMARHVPEDLRAEYLAGVSIKE